MRVGFLVLLSIIVTATGWASVQFNGPVSEVSSLADQSNTTITGSVSGIHDLYSAPSSWQVNSLSYTGSTSSVLDTSGGSIPQTVDVPEPAFTGIMLAAVCAAFIIGRNRSRIARVFSKN